MRSVVVLPAPSGPITPEHIPAGPHVARFTSATAFVALNDLLTPCASERADGPASVMALLRGAEVGRDGHARLEHRLFRLSTSTFTRNTSLARSFAVCTFRGANSACGEM